MTVDVHIPVPDLSNRLLFWHLQLCTLSLLLNIKKVPHQFGAVGPAALNALYQWQAELYVSQILSG